MIFSADSRLKISHFISIAAINFLIPVTSLVQVILIVRISGVELWSVLAVGISLGGIAQALIDKGYASSGSSLLLKQKNLFFLATDSIRHRFPIFIAFVTVGLIPFTLIEPSKYSLIYLSFFSLCISGLSVDWILISARKPNQLFLSSVTPRLATSILGLSIFYFTKNIFFVLFFTILGAALNLFLGVRLLYVTKLPEERSLEIVLGKQDFLLKITNDIFWLMPIPMVNLYSPGIAPIFSLIDRLVKFPLLFTQTITQFLTSSIVRSGDEFRRKIHQSLAIHLFSGLVLSIGTFLLLPVMVRVIANDALFVNSSDCVYIGMYSFFLIATRPLTQQYFLLTNQKKVILKINGFLLLVSFLMYSIVIDAFSQLLFFQALIQAAAFLLLLCIFLRQEVLDKRFI